MAAAVVLCVVSCAGERQPEPLPVTMPGSSHGIDYTRHADVWDEALPLGNGIMGCLLWGEGHPVRISLDRYDLWDLRDVPEYRSGEYSYDMLALWHHEGRYDDIRRIYEDPYRRAAPTKIPAGRIELGFEDSYTFEGAGLSVRDAEARMMLCGGSDVRVFVHAVEPVGMVRVATTSSIEPRLVAPAFSGDIDESHSGSGPDNPSDLARLGYPAPETLDGDTFRSFRQTGADGFQFAVYFGWKREADAWVGAWSIATNADGRDPLNVARDHAQKALAAGFDSMYAAHAAWWDRYWRQSSVSLPNDVLERQWYLEQYKFGSSSRRGHPPISLQGIWTADNGQIPPWKGDYHHDLNTELCYWPCYSGNHLDEGLSFIDWLWETRDNCRDWTRRFFGMPGMNVPMTADLLNRQIGGWVQYTHSATTGCWVAQHFHLHWKYSADREFLEERAYPYIADVARFIEAVSEKRDAGDDRSLPLSASPEVNDNRPEAFFPTITNYDLALCRWVMDAASECADSLGLADEAAHWRKVRDEFPELAVGDDGVLLVAKDHPLPFSHRHFSHLMAFHPLGTIDWEDGPGAQRIIRASLDDLYRLGTEWWCGYSFAWLGNMEARARDGEKAERALEIFSTAFTLRNSFHCNGDQSGKGYSNYTYRPFTLEGNFAAAAGIQEMLIQSHRGRIRVFPAIPADWDDVAFTTLRAQGAFLVSAKREAGAVTRVDVVAEKGGRCVVVSPWDGSDVVMDMEPGERRSLMGPEG